MIKIKLKEFVQHLTHDIEDEEEAEELMWGSLQYVGLVVMYFNSLESALDSVLCDHFTDRTDATGLIVLNKMNFSSKVELLKRFGDDFHVEMETPIEGYQQLLINLGESARLRNLVVHANWEATDEEGYTFVRLKMSKNGMQQEYFQFSEESLQKIAEIITNTKFELYAYWEARNDVLYGRN